MTVRLLATFVLLAAAAEAPASLEECAAIADTTARLSCYDALAGRPPDVGAPAPNADAFGKPAQQRAPAEPVSLTAHLVGSLGRWERGTVFRLDNGQVWKAVGDESAYYPGIPDNPEVTITKSYFGAYWMEIKAIHRKVQVKRVS